MTVLEYLSSALPRLAPKEERNAQPKNPFKLIASLTFLQFAFFFSGWLSWVCDAIDFFAVSLSTARLAAYFGIAVGQVTLSITLTLLFRPLGALIFGLLSDRYGRKWPLVANMSILAVISLGSGFVTSFNAFLAVRSLFGIAMGGVWGLAIAQALENMPVPARGLFSGFLQLGYPVGYLIIAAVNLNANIQQGENWRYLFYTGAAFSAFAAILRLCLPESGYFVERRAQAKASQDVTGSQKKNVVFIKETFNMLRANWARCIFGLVLMTAFNFYSHGSQDLYPTYIQVGKGLTPYLASVTTIIGNCGAIAGCAVGGYVSQYLGRRLTIISFCLLCCAMLPLWLLPTTFGGLAAGAFFVQAGVQGAYGVVPIYLSEISPVAFRAVWPGVAYQLGNMVSSAAAQIEATAGEKLRDPVTGIPAYGLVSAILIAVSAGVLILCCIIGVEQHGAKFEQGRAAFEKDGGLDVLDKGNQDLRMDSPSLGHHDLEKGELPVHEERVPRI